MIFTTDGLVTRVYDNGGSDKNIFLITPERGRISVTVKGGKALTGTQTSCSQMFTYGNFEIYDKQGHRWLKGGSVMTPFYELSSDIGRMALASYFCDIANELTDEGEDASYILRLLLNSMYAIGRKLKPQGQIKAVFELRAAAMSGYCPDVSACAGCGRREADVMYFNIADGNILCEDCKRKSDASADIPHGVYADDIAGGMSGACAVCVMTPGVLDAVRYALNSPDAKMLSYEIGRATDLSDFEAFGEKYILYHLGRGFGTLDFYKSVR